MSGWTLPKSLALAAQSRAGITYVQDDGSERGESYAALYGRAQAIARHLSANGIGRGHRVALLIPEAEGFVPALYGVTLTGAAVVPLAPPAHLAQLEASLGAWERMVTTAEVTAILTTTSLRAMLGSLHAACPTVQEIWPWEDAVVDEGPFENEARPDEIGLIQFTSGSTSHPKGVVLHHENLGANVEGITGPAGLGIGEGDVAVSWLPLFHDMGLIGVVMGSIHARVPLVLMPSLLFLKRPNEWLRTITRHRATASFAPNFAYELCVRRGAGKTNNGIDLSTWRVAGCGSEPIRPETLELFAQTYADRGFRATAFLPSYGLAETSLAATFHALNEPCRVDTVCSKALREEQRAVPCEPGKDDAVRLVSCGRPFPGHDVRIADSHDRALPERSVGEILLRGPSVMQGYYKDARHSAEALRGGWLHTGDLGYLAGGDLFVCGRKKDLIIVHGRNYHPQDLEWVASEVDGVRRGNVVAFCTADPEGGERVVLIAECRGRTNAEAVAAEIRRRVQEASGLHLYDVRVLPKGAIPKTTSGKVQRAKLKARYESGEPLHVATEPRTVLRHLISSQWGYTKVAARRLASRFGGRNGRTGLEA
jgi:fatty-acyl-CoA synthase